jgi:hypothetical protein
VTLTIERTVQCPACGHRFQLLERVAGEFSTHGRCLSCGHEGEIPVPDDILATQQLIVDKVFGTR